MAKYKRISANKVFAQAFAGHVGAHEASTKKVNQALVRLERAIEKRQFKVAIKNYYFLKRQFSLKEVINKVSGLESWGWKLAKFHKLSAMLDEWKKEFGKKQAKKKWAIKCRKIQGTFGLDNNPVVRTYVRAGFTIELRADGVEAVVA